MNILRLCFTIDATYVSQLGQYLDFTLEKRSSISKYYTLRYVWIKYIYLSLRQLKEWILLNCNQHISITHWQANDHEIRYAVEVSQKGSKSIILTLHVPIYKTWSIIMFTQSKIILTAQFILNGFNFWERLKRWIYLAE